MIKMSRYYNKIIPLFCGWPGSTRLFTLTSDKNSNVKCQDMIGKLISDLFFSVTLICENFVKKL